MNAFSIPEPRLRTVENHTPFAMFQCDKMGVGRKFFDTVVVKGTFALAPGKLAIAEEQADIALVDETWDPANAERSSLSKLKEVSGSAGYRYGKYNLEEGTVTGGLQWPLGFGGGAKF